MAEIDDLEAAVTADDAVIDSAVILINGIAAQIAAAVAAAQAAGATPAMLARIVAVGQNLKAHVDPLSAAVAANTPATPPPAGRRP